MSIKHILVHADASQSFRKRIDLAFGLADRFDAGVEALFARRPPYLPAAIDGVVSPQLIQAQSEQTKAVEVAARAAFDEAATGRKAAWRALDGLDSVVVSAGARLADLVVMGQPDPDSAEAATEYTAPAEVVMHGGRPVLVVPYAGTFGAGLEHVLVAWNDSREATRALADAMPFLRTARSVTVMMVDPPETQSPQDVGSKQVCEYLARHGVKAEARDAHNPDLEAGDVILSRAADLSADLIVMGAYGHTRFRELILGGATHTLMRHMTVPVLMAR